MAVAHQDNVTIAVLSDEHGRAVLTTDLSLTIKPYVNFTLDAQPTRVATRGRAEYSLTLHNLSNSLQTFVLSARDDADAVHVSWPSPLVTVKPGATAMVRVRAKPRQRPVTGQSQTYATQFRAVPQQEAEQPEHVRTAQVQLEHSIRRISCMAWAALALLFLVVFCGTAGFAISQRPDVQSVRAEWWRIAGLVWGQLLDALERTPASPTPVPLPTQGSASSPAALPEPSVAVSPEDSGASVLAVPSPDSNPPSSPPPVTSPPPAATPALHEAIEIPAADATVTLPLRILANVGPFNSEQINVTLCCLDGPPLKDRFTALDHNGNGVIVGTLAWTRDGQPPATQSATLELRSLSDQLLDRRKLTVLSNDDPRTRVVNLYWFSGNELPRTQAHIPMPEGVNIGTEALAEATLEELLWGSPVDAPELTTSIPTPKEILNFAGRDEDREPRVELLNLSIESGIATAHFSQEMAAYACDVARAQRIHEQVKSTLLQFSDTVIEVRITIEGEPWG